MNAMKMILSGGWELVITDDGERFIRPATWPSRKSRPVSHPVSEAMSKKIRSHGCVIKTHTHPLLTCYGIRGKRAKVKG